MKGLFVILYEGNSWRRLRPYVDTSRCDERVESLATRTHVFMDDFRVSKVGRTSMDPPRRSRVPV